MKTLRRQRPASGRGDALADDHVRVAHACASWLLGYPGDELVERLDTIRTLAGALPACLGGPLLRTVDAFDDAEPLELAERYVETFDTRRRGCLYLTYYSSGDTRRRGMALIRIRQRYLDAGLAVTTDELPDHLCVVLEFSAGTSLQTGLEILCENRPGVELLREHLATTGSPWHGAIEAVCATLPKISAAEIEAMATLAAEGPAEETVGLDGYGTNPNFDSIYPASRPGPTFCGSERAPRPVTISRTSEEVTS